MFDSGTERGRLALDAWIAARISIRIDALSPRKPGPLIG